MARRDADDLPFVDLPQSVTDAGGVPLDLASAISALVECILFGFSTLMFGMTLYVLVWDRRQRSGVHPGMVAVSFALYVFSTLHMAIDVERFFIGFFGEYRDAPDVYFARVAEWSHLFKTSLFMLQTALGDAVLMYRCYIVWSSLYAIILPFILWLGVLITGIGLLHEFASATDDAGVFHPSSAQWIASSFASSLAANLIGTGLLAYKVWKIDRDTSQIRTGGNALLPVVRVIADSGLLYSATVIALIGCYVAKSNAQYIMLDMTVQIIAIAFFLIILRLALVRRQVKDGSGGVLRSQGTTLTTEARRFSRQRPMSIQLNIVSENVETPNTAVYKWPCSPSRESSTSSLPA